MADLPAGLAALFGKPTAPAAKDPPPKPAGPSTPDFFAMMAKARGAVEPGEAPRPFEVPEVRKVAPAASPIDVRKAPPAASPIDLKGAAASSGFVYTDPAPRAFRGVAKAGAKKGPPKLRMPNVDAPTLADLFGLPEEPVLRKGSAADQAHRKEGVNDSSELRRILAVKRRPPFVEAPPPDLTELYRKASGKMRLFPIQSAALWEMRNAGGLFGPIGVGAGKTLISLLASKAMDSKMTVILVPPALRAQLLQIDIPRLAKEWQIPLANIRVVAYSQLSSATSADILEEIKPDLIAADEVHSLRYKNAARTKRFLRYMKAHPECRFVGLSGTMTRRSLVDYQHLAELALGKNSPLPNHYPTLMEWAEALDVSDDPMAPGALLKLCNDEELAEIAKAEDELGAQKIVRGAFRRRMVETPGVVATEESALGTSLVISAVKPSVPAEVARAITDVRVRWVTPAPSADEPGEELTEAIAVARVTRQLAAGFFYRWVWPGGQPDIEWLSARRDWNKEVREILRMSKAGLDSPMLIARAVEEGRYRSEFYEAWRAVKDRPEPPREAVWISDFLAREAIEWGKANGGKTTPAIVWFSHVALGEKIAELSGWPFFGAGTKASEELTRVDVKKTPVIVASVKAHGTGKNLQQFSLNLFTTPISSGADAEQAIARTHRPGQEADEVRCDVYVHTSETLAAFRSSVRDAAYIEATQGQRQKLNFAEKLGFGDRAFDFGGQTAEEIETEGIEWKGSRGIADLFAKR